MQSPAYREHISPAENSRSDPVHDARTRAGVHSAVDLARLSGPVEGQDDAPHFVFRLSRGECIHDSFAGGTDNRTSGGTDGGQSKIPISAPGAPAPSAASATLRHPFPSDSHTADARLSRFIFSSVVCRWSPTIPAASTALLSPGSRFSTRSKPCVSASRSGAKSLSFGARPQVRRH